MHSNGMGTAAQAQRSEQGAEDMTYDARKVQLVRARTDPGWHKGLTAAYRRKQMLKAMGYDCNAAGKEMNRIAGASKDKAAQRAARADARYFFKMNEKQRQGRSLKFID